MIKKLLIALLLINFTCMAQRFQEVVLWEIETKAKGLVFGISESVENAKFIIEDFQKRNIGSKYDLSAFKPVFKYTTFPVKSRDENPIANFRNIAGKLYKVLSKEDIRSIEIAKKSGFSSAVAYYMQARNAEHSYAAQRINDLMKNYIPYRIPSHSENNMVYTD